MSQSIISRVVGGITDQRARITNGQLTRNLTVLNNFNVLRLGFQLSFDATATQSGGPILSFGLCSGTSQGMADPTTLNWLGFYYSADLNYNAGGGTPYFDNNTNPTAKIAKRVGTTLTLGGSVMGTPMYSASPATVRSAIILQFVRGAPNWTLEAVYPNGAAGGQSNVTDVQFLDMMEAATMAGAAAAKANYVGIGTAALAFDEAAGVLDTVCIHWNKSATPLEISAIRVRKLS